MYMVHEPVNNSDNFLITDRLNQLNQTLNDIESKKMFSEHHLIKCIVQQKLKIFELQFGFDVKTLL